MSASEERLAYDPTSELWGEHRSRYRFATQFIRTHDRVLDVACGSGFGLSVLYDAGAWPIGVDYDADTLVNIRQRPARATLVRADSTRLPFATSSLDGAVSFETLEHVADACALIDELRRVLRPDGWLVLSTPNRAFGPPERHTGNPFHVREFTASELREVLAERFGEVRLYGQRPRAGYHYVPFLMVERTYAPSALAWKALVRLPYALKNRFALLVSGRSFYPGEDDYHFDAEDTDGAHALVAVAQ